MCVVVDTNVIPCLFNTKSSRHPEFSPLYNWIMNRRGKFVYGGTKYGKELQVLKRYAELLDELERSGRSHHANDSEVDKIEEDIKNRTVGTGFNDQHIVAIVIVSKCRLVCSENKSHYRFIKLRSLYPSDVKTPLIYKDGGNADLLTARHIVRFCGPCCS